MRKRFHSIFFTLLTGSFAVFGEHPIDRDMLEFEPSRDLREVILKLESLREEDIEESRLQYRSLTATVVRLPAEIDLPPTAIRRILSLNRDSPASPENVADTTTKISWLSADHYPFFAKIEKGEIFLFVSSSRNSAWAFYGRVGAPTIPRILNFEAEENLRISDLLGVPASELSSK